MKLWLHTHTYTHTHLAYKFLLTLLQVVLSTGKIFPAITPTGPFHLICFVILINFVLQWRILMQMLHVSMVTLFRLTALLNHLLIFLSAALNMADFDFSFDSAADLYSMESPCPGELMQHHEVVEKLWHCFRVAQQIKFIQFK